MRLTNNLYLLSGGNYSGGDYNALGNVYAFKTEEGLILVDCGLPDVSLPIINNTLEYYNLKKKITHVIITHAHVDHCGNAAYFQNMGAKVIVGEGDVDYLCKAGGFNLFGDTCYEQATYHIFPAFTPDIIIDKDKELTINRIIFQFILIPGHTMGSMAVLTNFEGKRILFTGDSIYPMGINCEKIDLGWRGDPKYDNNAFLSSLKKLSDTVECDMVLPGHGNLCVRNGTTVVRRAAKEAFHQLRF